LLLFYLTLTGLTGQPSVILLLIKNYINIIIWLFWFEWLIIINKKNSITL